jgi:hypothetical protein
MSEKFRKLAAVKLLELTLFSDCTNEDADAITKVAIDLLKEGE